MGAAGVNQWNPPRAVLCTCGWGGRFRDLRTANAAVAVHLEEGSEGCDHAVALWLDEGAR